MRSVIQFGIRGLNVQIDSSNMIDGSGLSGNYAAVPHQYFIKHYFRLML